MIRSKTGFLFHKQSGFTLLEVIAVIAIVAVIAAALSAVFTVAREKGCRAVCLSNMRQISIAVSLYASDNENTYPAATVDDFTGSHWTTQIQPYLDGSTAVFHCPGDPTKLGVPEQSYTVPKSDPGLFVDSYGLNFNLHATVSSYKGHLSLSPPVPESSVVSPSRTVMLFEVSNDVDSTHPEYEAGGATGNGGNICSDGISADVPCGSPVVPVILKGNTGYVPLYATGDIGGRKLNGGSGQGARHSGGADYVACDGHAVWLRPEDVSGGRNAPLSSCEQGTAPDLAPSCWTSRYSVTQAAGTASDHYRLTFSTR